MTPPAANAVLPIDESTPALAALEARVRHDLGYIQHPNREWVPALAAPDGSRALDVLVVGAGQCGLAITFGLRMQSVDNVLLIDRAAPGEEGPWVTYARMNTLRTPKHLIGPDLGIPSLTPRAWYEARYGIDAWLALGRIARRDWMAYLDWYRRVLGIAVENRTALEALDGVQSDGRWLVRATLATPLGRRVVHARRVVLATGIDGSGRWEVPVVVRESLPRHLYAHTADPIDFDALRGKAVGVLGAGASAFDNAGTALEAGAGAVHLFFRRDRLPTVNPNRWMEKAGVLGHWGDLPDAWKWRFLRHFHVVNQPPPQDTFERCTAFPNFHLHAAAPWTNAAERDGRVHVETPRGAFAFDYVIAGTGFVFDYALRPELAAHAEAIATWADRFTPPAGEAHEVLGTYPYLGAAFELTPRRGEDRPWLAQIHNFTWGSHLSHGVSGSAISPMKYSVPRLVNGLTRALYVEDAALHYASLEAYAEPELVAPAYAAILERAERRYSPP